MAVVGMLQYSLLATKYMEKNSLKTDVECYTVLAQWLNDYQQGMGMAQID